MTRIALSLALFATCSLDVTAAACPPEQYEVCVTDCVCLPDVRGVLGPLPGEVSRVASGALQQWLVQARADALASGVEPMPPAIREKLTPYFDAALLEGARYRIGDSSELGAASAMLHDPDIKAVTLVDVILFRDREGALDDVAIWAHELVHAQQYREWGVEGFASRYAEDADSVEQPAYEMQFRVAKALRGK
ncbi:eCIS core domain-containing protein [Pseudomonas sp. MAHUQ-62]|uniref:eCIS core domain-containing protein n=1 Tax=Pseudomonas sp. GCM10023245 TaxID=3252652 RepID=UPI003611396A